MSPRWFTPLLVVLALLVGLVTASAAQSYSNGHLPESALSPVATGVQCAHPGDELANRAAAGYNTAALAAGKKLTDNGCMSAYRDYAGQVYLYTHCPSLCAVPGTSNHGIGEAIDVALWVRSYIDSTHGVFGFDKACSDAPSEWWHVKFCRPFGRPNPGVHLKSPRLTRGSGGPGQAPWVKKAQKLLRRHGAKHLTPDGALGARTCFAIKQLKSAAHLHGDCVVGRATWKLLRSPVVKPNPPPKPGHHGGHGHGHPGGHNHGHPHGHGHPGGPGGGHSGPVYGVDISQAQGDINWDAVRHDGRRFAIVKATEGQDFRDPTFSAARLDAIQRAGIVPGVYHFLRPRSDRHGSREATWFVHVITQAGYGKGMLPPVIDVETTTLSPDQTCQYVRSFYQRVRRTLHVHPIIYTFPSFVTSEFGGCGWIAEKRLWIANPGVSQPTVPSPWSAYLIWQYSFTGRVAGINGDVDLDKLPGGVKTLHRLQVQPASKLTRKPKARVPATERGVYVPEWPSQLFAIGFPAGE